MLKTYFTILLSLSFPYAYSQVNDSIKVEHLILVVEAQPSFIKENLQYPESAKRDSIEGIVYVLCWVDTSGRTVDHQVIKGVREDLDEEALRVARLIHFDKSAMQAGKPVKVRYNIPMEFTLNPPHRVRRSKQRTGSS